MSKTRNQKSFEYLLFVKYILRSKKKKKKYMCTLFSAIFHCPLCLMSTYLVPKSRSEHLHYNRDFKLQIPVSLGYIFVSRMTRCDNESCKTTLKSAISTIHHFILLKLEIRCLL